MNADAFQSLRTTIAERLPKAERSFVDIVTAIAGLFATVAYADRTITDEEADMVRDQLSRIEALSRQDAEVIADVLHEHALHLSTTFAQRFTRTIREHLDESGRTEVLDALLTLAAADGTITHVEVTTLRNVTNAMGLSQAHYNELQAKYRDRLSFL